MSVCVHASESAYRGLSVCLRVLCLCVGQSVCVSVCLYVYPSCSVCIMLQLETLCLSFSPCAVGQPLRMLLLRSRLCLHPSLPLVFTQMNDSLWSLPHRP